MFTENFLNTQYIPNYYVERVLKTSVVLLKCTIALVSNHYWRGVNSSLKTLFASNTNGGKITWMSIIKIQLDMIYRPIGNMDHHLQYYFTAF